MSAPDVSWVAGHDWRMLIGGELVPAASGRTFACISPIDLRAVCALPDGGEADVERAVSAASAAAHDWARLPVRERAATVRALAGVLRRHRRELAALDALDVGNAYSAMLGDVEQGAIGIELLSEMAFRLAGETLPATNTHLHYTTRAPYGVVARITAFNHPIMFAAQKIAAPLVAGNAVILKPSEHSCLSALRMGELLADHLPKGLLSVVVGNGGPVPAALVRHPAVPRIGFIGSEPTGRAIQRAAAEVAVKHVTLELGGKNAMIVCPDVDIAAAAAGAVKGMNFTGWQSQSCSSTSRLLVHESVADDVVAAIVERVAAIRIGSPLSPETQMGTLATEAQYRKSLHHIDLAAREGARLVTGGAKPAGEAYERGLYLAPTVFDGVTPDMTIAREEVFGPVLSVMRWTEEREVVRVANDVRYGLTAAVWTNHLGRGLALAHRLDAGYVWVNDAATHFPGVPFGGYKASGVGHEESVEELVSYTRLKSVNVRAWPSDRQDPSDGSTN
ncbi:aldehyde dehydrogenase family protein [Pseudonocardia acaciae]|uniref:aldehyde dehydrogenase family protein n=1 Tax=Pseudonocardia acaciae TaxID=551276 RepID=UPI0006850C5D|nr:aldehyde dehydrogenase family protein [Pseudonocardia acaciae]